MSIKDVIKNSVYENFVGETGLSFLSICLILFIACLVGLYIFGVYKYFSRSAFYSKDLNITLAGMVVVVAAVMIAMQANLLVSLGMVGALSIVRFRTAVKNPMDLLYLFWGISAGIICGVGLHLLVAVLCIVMTVLIFILGKIPNSKAPDLLVMRLKSGADLGEIFEEIKKKCGYAKENSIVVKNGEKEVIYEIQSKNPDVLLSVLETKEDIVSINWITHHGEMRS